LRKLKHTHAIFCQSTFCFFALSHIQAAVRRFTVPPAAYEPISEWLG
jgi:hypothetical protein